MKTFQEFNLSLYALTTMLEKDARIVSNLSGSQNPTNDMEQEIKAITNLYNDVQEFAGGAATYFVAIRLQGVEGGETLNYVVERCKVLGSPVVTYKLTLHVGGIDYKSNVK